MITHSIRYRAKEYKYAYGLNSFWENNKYFSFNIYIQEEQWQIFYIKKDNKVYTGLLYDDMSYCAPVLSDATDDYISGSLSVEDLFLIRSYSEDKSKDSILEKIISEVTEDDNPVIFFYYFKK